MTDIKRHLPRYLTKDEFVSNILTASEIELNKIELLIEDLENQLNPKTATWRLKIWKELFGLKEENLEELRVKILSRMSQETPLTKQSIEKMIKNITGLEAEIEERPSENTFIIHFETCKSIKNVSNAIRDIVPAHLKFDYGHKLKINSIGVSHSSKTINYDYEECSKVECGTGIYTRENINLRCSIQIKSAAKDRYLNYEIKECGEDLYKIDIQKSDSKLVITKIGKSKELKYQVKECGVGVSE